MGAVGIQQGLAWIPVVNKGVYREGVEKVAYRYPGGHARRVSEGPQTKKTSLGLSQFTRTTTKVSVQGWKMSYAAMQTSITRQTHSHQTQDILRPSQLKPDFSLASVHEHKQHRRKTDKSLNYQIPGALFCPSISSEWKVGFHKVNPFKLLLSAVPLGTPKSTT